MIAEVTETLVDTYCPEEQYSEEWDLKGLSETIHGQFGLDLINPEELKDMGHEGLLAEVKERLQKAYTEKEERLKQDQGVQPDLFRYLEKMVLLQVTDQHWKDHLLGMDQLRDGIGLRGYGQKDPLAEYKREGYDMFAGMMARNKRGHS